MANEYDDDSGVAPETATAAAAAVTATETIINPYQNIELIRHRKFISHLGVAFIDLVCMERKWLRPPRPILRRLCGQINYGTLNAIFGPRHCGKTCLLKCLSGLQRFEPESMIFLNVDIPPRVFFLSAAIRDNLLLSLTVDETLQYAFRFRNPGAGDAKRRATIEEILTDTALDSVRFLRVGDCCLEDQFKTQVAMAIATLERPNLIFWEEPFTHLDNVSIGNLVHLLKQLSRMYSLAITCSTSQILDSDVLSIFDKLYVLSRGGFCVYEGSVEHMSLFLSESGIVISSNIQTPIERLMKIASKPTEVTMRVAARVYATRDDILHYAQKYGTFSEWGMEPSRSRVNFSNIFNLFSRGLIHRYRCYWSLVIIQYFTLVCGILLLISTFEPGIGRPDSCYNRTSRPVYAQLIVLNSSGGGNGGAPIPTINSDNVVVIHGQHLVEDNVQFLFVTTASLALYHLFVAIIAFNEEIMVACNEHRNGWININSFIVVKNLIDMMMPTVNTVSCCAIAYIFLYRDFMTGWRFGIFFLVQFASVTCAQSLGFAISVITLYDRRLATIIIGCSSVILVLFSGYLIPLTNIEPWVEFIFHLSFVRQSFHLTLMSVYGFERCGHGGGRGRHRRRLESYVMEKFQINHDRDHLWNSMFMALHYIVCCALVWGILMTEVGSRQQKKKKPTPEKISPIDSEKIGSPAKKY